MPDFKVSPSDAASSPAASAVDGHVPQKKRIRAVVACSYCRSKRSKCDGIPGKQACTQCQQRGIECEMSDGKRNRGHYKPQVEALATRVRMLEESLAEARAANNQLIAQMQKQQHHQQENSQPPNTAPNTAFDPIPLTAWDQMQMDDGSSVGVGLGLQDHRLDVESVPARAESIAASSTMPPPTHVFSPSVHQSSCLSSHSHNPNQNLNSHHQLDNGSIVLSNVGTSNMYNINDNNNNTHYNNNTNYNSASYALSVSQSVDPSAAHQNVPVPPSPTLPSTHTVNLAVPIPIVRHQPFCAALDLSSPVVDYLLGLFFHRYQLMMRFVSQQVFMTQYAENTDADERDGTTRAKTTAGKTGKANGSAFKRHHPCCHKQNCALFLAMLAAAIRYSTRADVTKRFLRSDGENRLATAARRAVETEVSRPTLATVQTILILCEVETTLDNQMTSYMYTCLASKLIFEMGLDLGSSTSSKALTAEETTIRHWLVWAASVHDQFWAVFLRRPLAIKNSALHLSRMAWRFAGGDRDRDPNHRGPQTSSDVPAQPTFEDEVNEDIMDFMELAREITDALYGASSLRTLLQRPASASQSDCGFGYENPNSSSTPDGTSDGSSTYYSQYATGGLPQILHEHAAQQQANNQLPDVAQLDARLNDWFGTLSDKVRQGPVSGHDCYYFLFVLHLHFHATKIILHRTRAFATEIGGGSPMLHHPRRQSPLASAPEIDESAAASMAALGQASISIAKLFETFRRREDIRMLQCTGVQWAAIASEALTWHIETLPIDGAIEAVAHLQSLGRTLKDMTRTFLPAIYAYDRTTNALRMFQQRINGGSDSPPQAQMLQVLFHEQQLQQLQHQQQQQHQHQHLQQQRLAALAAANPHPRSMSTLSAAPSSSQHQPFLSTLSAPDLAPSLSVSAATFSASLAAAASFDTDSAAGSRVGADGTGSVSALSMPTAKEQLQHVDAVFAAPPGQGLNPEISAGAIQVAWPENGAWDWCDMMGK